MSKLKSEVFGRKPSEDSRLTDFRDILNNRNWSEFLSDKSPSQQAEEIESFLLDLARRGHRLFMHEVAQLQYPRAIQNVIKSRDGIFKKLKSCGFDGHERYIRNRWKLLSRYAEKRSAILTCPGLCLLQHQPAIQKNCGSLRRQLTSSPCRL